MPKYRCPVCGASHKEPVPNCRLCGQNMGPNAVSTFETPVASEYHRKRGIKGVFLIGAGLVVLILSVTLALGITKPTREMEAVKNKISGSADGWTTQVEQEGKFTVELPGDRTRQTVAFPVTDTGKLTVWTATIGTDTSIQVGFGPVRETLGATTTTSTEAPATKLLRIKEQLVQKWANAAGLTPSFLEIKEGSLGGLPAIVVHTTSPKLRLQTAEAYGDLVFALNGTTLYVIEVLSIYSDAPQLPRLAGTFHLI
jgi:hypothetical protein